MYYQGKNSRFSYSLLYQEAKAFIGRERDFVAILSCIASLLFHRLPRVNWAGFYLLKKADLIVGPFQGKPACVRIPVGRGVCGKAVLSKKYICVSDVTKFSDYISCDEKTRSEIAIPFIRNGKIIGVLDIDSPVQDRFSEKDFLGLKPILSLLIAKSHIASKKA